MAALAQTWPYWYGLVSAITIVILATIRPSRTITIWLILHAVTYCISAICVLWMFVWDSSPEGTLILLPPLMGSSFWSFLPLIRRDYCTAAARLQTSTAALAGFWIYVSLLFNEGVLIGYHFSVFSIFWIVAAAWITRARIEYDMVDRTLNKRPFARFSIAAVILWTSLLAVCMTYYRLLPIAMHTSN